MIAAAVSFQEPSSPLQTQETSLQPIHRFCELLYNRDSYLSHLVFVPALKACSSISTGTQIHGQSVKRNLSSDLFIQTSLLSMYSSFGHFDTSLKVFDKMSKRSVVSWTAMMGACLNADKPTMAVSIFRQMQESGIKPDKFALVSILSACTRLEALNLGRWVHLYMERMGVELTVHVGTALLDMYCKCGCLDDALAVFNSMQMKSARSWNAMLHGLSVHGRGMKAIEMFREMEMEGRVTPTEVTFLSVLCGCSHCGMVEEGRYYFDLMQRKYKMVPNVKHYGCMVDLHGRAGLLDEAFKMVTEMPIEPNVIVWGALLSACRAKNDLDMAERVNERMAGMQNCIPGKDTSNYVILSNIYKQKGLMTKMAEVRSKVGKKPTGRSWIETGSNLHEFVVGDAKHPMWTKIMDMLTEIMQKVGRVEDEIEEVPHSEKVALAFGLLSTSKRSPIRISKNLRICKDCHDVMKSVSDIYGRDIVVRDCTRFHLFRGGSCSCKDYW